MSVNEPTYKIYLLSRWYVIIEYPKDDYRLNRMEGFDSLQEAEEFIVMEKLCY